MTFPATNTETKVREGITLLKLPSMAVSQDITDEQLMVRVQEGHQAALSALYDRYVGRVYGMALQKLADPAEAEDVTHDVFVNL